MEREKGGFCETGKGGGGFSGKGREREKGFRGGLQLEVKWSGCRCRQDRLLSHKHTKRLYQMRTI